MNKLFALLTMLFTITAFTAEVGDQVSNLSLSHLQKDGGLTQHGVLETDQADQFVALEFFQTNCGACHINLPKFSALHSKLSDKAIFRLVALDRRVSKVSTYLEEKKSLINFEIALDNKRALSKAFEVYATPTLFIMNSNNEIVFKHVGVLGADDIAKIEKLLK